MHWVNNFRLCVALFVLTGYLAFAQHPKAGAHPADKSAGDSHLLLGKQFGAQGKWKDAENELRIYKFQNPDSTEAVVLHAESLIKIGQPFDAALEIQAFLQHHPDALRAHELYAVLAAEPLRDVNLAINELNICVKLAPRDFQAWESLGDSYMDQSKGEQAVGAYEMAVRLRPGDAVAVASLGRAYSEGGLGEKADREFKRAAQLAARPGQPAQAAATVDYLWGQYLADKGSAEAALPALTRAIAFNPRSPDAYYWRARAYDKTGDRERAIADARKAIELSPLDKGSAVFLITLYRKAGAIEEAHKYADLAQKITDAEQAKQTFGRELRDTLGKAEPLLLAGNFVDAIPLYESIVKQLPTFYEAYFDLGTCYAQTGRVGDAETALRKYLSLQPISADGHAALGLVLAEQNKNDEAIAEFSQAIQIDPTQVEARKALANEYLQQQRTADAISVLKRGQDGHDIQLEMMLASALSKNGDFSSAVAAADRAIAIDPASQPARQLKQDLLSGAPRAGDH